MADPINQAVLWLGEILARFGHIAAAALVVYWVWVLFNRLTDSTDPSYRKSSSSGIGAAVIVVSGSYLSMVLAAVIGGLLWVAGMLTPAIAAVLVGGVLLHVVLEKREDMGGEPVIGDD